MQNKRAKLNILSPAGSPEQLLAAVNNGCDAVYLGLDSFNARMKAPNFTLENLSYWVNYCHLFGVKVYVAINTSIKNDEFIKAVELLRGVYNALADGIIVTDLALMRIAGKLPKPFDVVASTQLSVHDKYGAEFVKKNGASTVVCARECSFDGIKEIASTGINVECFLHGAMCVCQSGQCLFSSMVGGNSGNRGLCAQPCRKYYSLADGSVSGYLLSARDICSLNTFESLVDAGATTFKIEGRNRRAEYAGITAKIYKRIADKGACDIDADYTELAEMFNRSMSYNHYLSGSNADIVYPAIQNHTGVNVGVVRKGQLYAFCPIIKGDGLKVLDGNREICGGIALESGSGLLRAQFGSKVVDGMLVNRTTSVELCQEAVSARRKLDVTVKFSAHQEANALVSAKCGDVEVDLKSDFVVPAAYKKATDVKEIAEQLSKTGDTYYTISDIIIDIGDVFIAKSQINALRRQVLDKLTESIVGAYNARFANRSGVVVDNAEGLIDVANGTASSPTSLAVNCFNKNQLKDAAGVADYVIYSAADLDLDAVKASVDFGAYLDLSPFADLNYFPQLLADASLKVVCHNVGQVEFARAHNLHYIAGAGLNLFNDYIVNVFNDADTFVYSQELTLNEISSFKNSGGLTFVDGKIVLMKLSHCPYKLIFKCDCADCKEATAGKLTYCDEIGNKFYITRRRAGRCLFSLENGNKLSAVGKLKRAGRYLIDFDTAVVKHYSNLNSGIDDGYSETAPYTKGRLFDKIK